MMIVAPNQGFLARVTAVLTVVTSLLVIRSTVGQEWKPLFNGKNMDGWVYVNTPPDTWSIQDSMLICSGKPNGEIRTDRMYQNFVLELEWRHMVAGGNAGIFVWADDITSRGVPFHRGIEVQVLENDYGNSDSHTTHGDIFPIHGATMVPVNGRGGSRAFPTENRSKPSPEWNHYRITCQDGAISLEVNGALVTQGKECNPRKGYICIESEGGVVHYKNIKIQELPDTPVDTKLVAMANRGFRSLYTGLDHRGWVAPNETIRHWQVDDWVLRYDGDTTVASTLQSSELFGNFGFVIDVRLLEADSSLDIFFRDDGEASLQLSKQASALSKQLAEPGNWNRLEGEVRGGKLSLSLNGNSVLQGKDLKNALPMAWRLTPKGKVELANLFVRTIRD